MKDIIQKPQIKIYYEGELDLVATYKPAVKKSVKVAAEKFAETIDRWFVEHKW